MGAEGRGTMRAVIVYESLYGNTHQIAEAIGDGVRQAEPDAQVTCLRVGDASPDVASGADLLVVGGPTHMLRMSSQRSRQMGIEAEQKAAAENKPTHPIEPGADGPGVRDWSEGLHQAARGGQAAAFDTRLPSPLSGGAARGIARRLRRHGYMLAAKPEGFIVEGAQGPLRSGERERALAWGAGLARRLAH